MSDSDSDISVDYAEPHLRHRCTVLDLENFCKSKYLSLEKMIKWTDNIRWTDGALVEALNRSSYFHRVCMNSKVTKEIVEHLLKLHPDPVVTCVDMTDLDIFDAYPLHCACINKDCPNSVVKLLKRNVALRQFCCMPDNWANYYPSEPMTGLPIHYYLSRTSNVDIEIVKFLVEEYPESCSMADDIEDFMNLIPIHVALANPNVGSMEPVILYLINTCPDSLEIADSCDNATLHIACGNKHITSDIVQLILDRCPESLRRVNNVGATPLHVACQRNENVTTKIVRTILSVWPEAARHRATGDSGKLPLHYLCDDNKELNDLEADRIISLLLEAYPESVVLSFESNESRGLPLHLAAGSRSSSFCKILLEAYPSALKLQDVDGYVPFHASCKGRLETLIFFYHLYPEAINMNSSALPIHIAAGHHGKNTTEIIEFLHSLDPDCASREANGSKKGWLPLHIACESLHHANAEGVVGLLSNIANGEGVAKLLFDLYPEAVITRIPDGRTPAEILTGRGNDLVAFSTFFFLGTQERYARMASDDHRNITPDTEGRLPLHHELKEKCTRLGTIKLLVKGNPGAFHVADNKGELPLKIACQSSISGVVRFLAECYQGCLSECDATKNYPLHFACQAGNTDVVKYLLERPMSSVSKCNFNGMLPLHLFCEFVRNNVDDEEDPLYLETIWKLLLAFPGAVLG